MSGPLDRFARPCQFLFSFFLCVFTSTAESGSEAEDIARGFVLLCNSPPLSEFNGSKIFFRHSYTYYSSKVVGKSSYASSGNLPGYDEYVPMVDKAFDATWKNQASLQRSHSSKGTPLPDPPKTPEGIRARIWVFLTVFCLTLFTLFRSVTCRVTKKLPAVSSDDNLPPSMTQANTEAILLSSMKKRLGELEEMVDTLQSKSSEMPYEKAELLNAAVCRVEALEAELIATKMALFEALMRQEELLAYIDRKEEAKLRKKKLFW